MVRLTRLTIDHIASERWQTVKIPSWLVSHRIAGLQVACRERLHLSIFSSRTLDGAIAALLLFLLEDFVSVRFIRQDMLIHELLKSEPTL